MNAAAQLYMSEAEYLDYDDRMDGQTELRNGRVVAMEDSTGLHSLITTHIAGFMRPIFVQSGLWTVVFSARIRAANNNFLKPDVAVFRGQPGMSLVRRLWADPIVVIEVLSPSTRDYDRGDKFDLYREMPSLAEYAVVEQTRAQVDLYRRLPDGRGWHLVTYRGLEAEVEFTAISLKLPMREIYLGIDLNPPMLQLVEPPPDR